MNITIYSSTAENSRIDKSSYLTQEAQYSGTLREPTSILSPSVVVQSTGLPSGNYAYIPDFNRYYFITNITALTLNLWRVDMRCDVLMSHKDELLNLYAYVSRYQYSEETEFIDKVRPVKSVPNIIPLTVTYAEWADTLADGITSQPFAIFIFDDTLNLSNGNITTQTRYIQDSEGNRWNIANGVGLCSPIGNTCRIYGILMDNNGIENVRKIVNTLSQDSAKLSHLISSYLIPRFSRPSSGASVVSSIPVGDSEITFDNDGPIYYFSSNVSEITTINYDLSLTDFPNIYYFEPYSKYYIYIPFVGSVNIESKYFYKRKLLVRICFDYTVCQGYYVIFSCKVGETYPLVISSGQFQYGSPYPISSTGAAEQERQRAYNQLVMNTQMDSATFKFVASQAQNAGNLLTDIFSGQFANIGSRGGNLASAGLTYAGALNEAASMYEAKEILNVQIGSPININSSLALFETCPTSIILYRSFVDPSIDEEDFAKLCGLPYNKYIQLNGLNGFAIVSDIHLENLPSCLEDEKTELHSLLRHGCIYETTTS